MHFVFMGVSGSGKSTVAQHVAERLSLPFAEADDFHPHPNIDKMSQGVPLTDEDRRPWLSALAGWIAAHESHGQATIMACSALRRSYRDLLREGAPDVRFIHLDGSRELIADRLQERSCHFMPTGLLDSQIATLEPLRPDENGATLDISPSAEELIERAARTIAAALGLDPSARR
ncbi:gluconokinase [Allosalinactinospora lopnorensis]|uniref:gluconokinase n=1 Tax=Allosalinactinospora lopnorensis TaxID=1352348 RepID=UPI000623F0F9|nr:gluconokinase [Allosalinactinospora lopnorensis]